MKITTKAWRNYINALARIDRAAVDDMNRYLAKIRADIEVGNITQDEGTKKIIDYAYAVATKYGEAGGALACEMYDVVARLQNAKVPPAVPAPTATYGEISKVVYGIRLQSDSDAMLASGVGRQVKLVSADTMQKNAIRDGAEWAWIPMGDTCAFCITLASGGWQKASKNAQKNGHAEHIHANCDCTYAVRHSDNIDVEGYDPAKYRQMYYGTDEPTPTQRINAMRREFYAENKDRINAQKRDAYARRKALNSSNAEEFNVTNKNGTAISFDDKITRNDKFAKANELIKQLSNEYSTRLENVTVGAEKAAGDVDISGARMRLNTSEQTAALHEFAHTLANSKADKYGMTSDKEFWKEVSKVRREYRRDVDKNQDVLRYISTYEHASRDIDEFLAEAFAHAKAKELGLDLPKKYGNDFTYSDKVLKIVDRYFKNKAKK